MDPSTTLFTFMFQTAPPSQSVSLVGSWDNFSKRYPMQKDSRRGHNQWRGCYSFQDIICDGDGSGSPKRNGGLKMGHTYWYYFELDDGTEIHDTAQPFTSSCPYLPGQPVNTLCVPIEVSPLRQRSASLGSMTGGFKTMNPEDRYLTPRAPPAVPRLARLDTSPAIADRQRSTRSMSPKESRSPWPARTFFKLKMSSSASAADRLRPQAPWDFPKPRPEERIESSSASSQSSANRLPDESNCRFPVSHSGLPHAHRQFSHTTFSSERPISPLNYHLDSNATNRLARSFNVTEGLSIVSEDDGNFATSNSIPDPEKGLSPASTASHGIPLAQPRTALVETKPLPMLPNVPSSSPHIELSAHPSLHSPSMIPQPLRLPPPPTTNQADSVALLSPTISLSSLEQKTIPRSHFSLDTISSGFLSPSESHSSMTSSIYDSHDDDEPIIEENDEGMNHVRTSGRDFIGYSLPTGDFGSELTLRKGVEDGFNADIQPQTAFVPHAHDPLSPSLGEESNLDHFLTDMGYLGRMIVGK